MRPRTPTAYGFAYHTARAEAHVPSFQVGAADPALEPKSCLLHGLQRADAGEENVAARHMAIIICSANTHQIIVFSYYLQVAHSLPDSWVDWSHQNLLGTQQACQQQRGHVNSTTANGNNNAFSPLWQRLHLANTGGRVS